ncbi:hypothetical protein BKA93DRAFT_859382 [Sparassis latifolia]
MPPRISSKPSRQDAQRDEAFVKDMTERYTNYLVIAETCGRTVRGMGYGEDDADRVRPVYDQVVRDWYNDPTTIILRTNSADPKEQAAFFRQCDEICATPLDSLYKCFWVGFAATAGAQGLRSLFSKHPAKSKILREASDESIRRLIGEQGFQQLAKLASSLNPRQMENASSLDPRTMDPMERIGETIRYKDENNSIVECTIEDAGTSVVKGDFFKLSYLSGGQKEVSSEEMALILRNAV